jgi:hypothetical protein
MKQIMCSWRYFQLPDEQKTMIAKIFAPETKFQLLPNRRQPDLTKIQYDPFSISYTKDNSLFHVLYSS